jgi:hypothetical protein
MSRKTITDLYRGFEQTHAAYQAVPDTEGAGRKRYEQLLEKACAIARRIAQTPAANLDEVALKLRVTAWDIGDRRYSKLEELDHWQPNPQLSRGTHYLAIASLREDVHRLCGGERQRSAGARAHAGAAAH